MLQLQGVSTLMLSASHPVRNAQQGQMADYACNLITDQVITREQNKGGEGGEGDQEGRCLGGGRGVGRVAYLSNHAPEGIALDAVKRNGNQNLMENSRNAEANQQAQPLFVPFGFDRDVDVLDHPLVDWHVPKGPILANAFSIPPRLHIQ